MMMFAVVIAFLCFYHAERILSAIAKFLFTSVGKGRSGLKWKRGEVGEGSGEGRRRRISECTKYNSPTTQQILHFGMPLGGYCPVSYIFGKLFSGTTFLQQSTYLAFLGVTLGLSPKLYIFIKFF